MNELHLFAGAGGGILGGHLLGHTVVCAVEYNTYCQQVLQARQRDGYLPPFPIWGDVTTFDGRPWRGCVDIICAGFPCQPFSVAGIHKAGNDERNRWPDTVRIIGEVRPPHVLLENVPALLAGSHGYMHTILGELAALGYDARWDCIPAIAVGANHQRDRLWIVAHDRRQHGEARRNTGLQATRAGRELDTTDNKSGGTRGGQEATVADTNGARCKGQRESSVLQAQLPKFTSPRWWSVEPRLDRVANGMADRLDRLRAIGNGQVAAVAQNAWRVLQ